MMPMTPPIRAKTSASTKNWVRTWRSSAPIARRMPISRVRSVTDTSMIFMMPMPPTKRLTPATALRSPVRSVEVEVMVEMSWLMSRTVKVSSLSGPTRRISRRICSILAVTAGMSPLVAAEM